VDHKTELCRFLRDDRAQAAAYGIGKTDMRNNSAAKESTVWALAGPIKELRG
jgi:hypothetical protein